MVCRVYQDKRAPRVERRPLRRSRSPLRNCGQRRHLEDAGWIGVWVGVADRPLVGDSGVERLSRAGEAPSVEDRVPPQFPPARSLDGRWREPISIAPTHWEWEGPMKFWPASSMAVVLLLTAAGSAYGQPFPKFLALDVFGGLHMPAERNAERSRENEMIGWSLGSTVRFSPWWGIKGELARASNDEFHASHYLGGVEFTSPYSVGAYPTRFWGHTLVGYANDRSDIGFSQAGPAFVAGGGFDVAVFRLQFDYLRSTRPIERPKNDMRIFVGGAVAVWFRGCQPEGCSGIAIGSSR